MWRISGRSTMHLPPARALSSLGSGLTGVMRSMLSISWVLSSSARHGEMSLGLKMRAADVATVRVKKLRSSTLMARLTGGAAMAGADMSWGCFVFRAARLALDVWPRATFGFEFMFRRQQ